MKKTVTFVFLLSTLLLAITLGAQADNTVCGGAIFLVPDGSLHEGTFTSLGQARHFRFVARANRSYGIMVENLSPTDGEQNVSISAPTDACAGTQLPTRSTPQIEPFSNTGSGMSQFGGVRLSLKTASDTDVFFVVSTGIASVPGDFRVRMEETTLFNPLWSTFGGFETFYRFQNATNSGCSVTLRLVSDLGTVVANPTFTVSANSTAATRTTGPTDLDLGNDQAGQAVITHDCPPGAIQVDGFTGRFDLATPVVLPIKIQAARQMR